jgi:hypothetical protein
VAIYIAGRIKSNIRELKAFDSVIARPLTGRNSPSLQEVLKTSWIMTSGR